MAGGARTDAEPGKEEGEAVGGGEDREARQTRNRLRSTGRSHNPTGNNDTARRGVSEPTRSCQARFPALRRKQLYMNVSRRQYKNWSEDGPTYPIVGEYANALRSSADQYRKSSGVCGTALTLLGGFPDLPTR